MLVVIGATETEIFWDICLQPSLGEALRMLDPTIPIMQ